MVWVLLTAIAPLLIQAYPLNRVTINYAGPVDFVIIGVYIPTDGYWYFTDAVSPLYSLSYSAPTLVTTFLYYIFKNPKMVVTTW